MIKPNAKVRLKASSYPYDYYHDRYQESYWKAFSAVLGTDAFKVAGQGSLSSKLHKGLRRLRFASRFNSSNEKSNYSRITNSIDCIAKVVGAKAPEVATVGTYEFNLGEIPLRFCIDSSDSGELLVGRSWLDADLIFKTNYWPTKAYPSNVVPLYNANPLVYKNVRALIDLRSQPKEFDFCLIVRVWGGVNEIEGVEHCLRILESANQYIGKKFLYGYLVAGDTEASRKRLESQGIPCGTNLMPLRDLWSVSARSTLNIIRLGMHDCIPWRFFDLLAMGAVPVLDRLPFTEWPIAITEGRHFLNLGIHPHDETTTFQTSGNYSEIPEKLLRFINDKSLVSQMREATKEYFDENLALEAAGRFLLKTLTQAAIAKSTKA